MTTYRLCFVLRKEVKRRTLGEPGCARKREQSAPARVWRKSGHRVATGKSKRTQLHGLSGNHGAPFDAAVPAPDALPPTPRAYPAAIRKDISKPSRSSTPTSRSKSQRSAKIAPPTPVPFSCQTLRTVSTESGSSMPPSNRPGKAQLGLRSPARTKNRLVITTNGGICSSPSGVTGATQHSTKPITRLRI